MAKITNCMEVRHRLQNSFWCFLSTRQMGFLCDSNNIFEAVNKEKVCLVAFKLNLTRTDRRAHVLFLCPFVKSNLHAALFAELGRGTATFTWCILCLKKCVSAISSILLKVVFFFFFGLGCADNSHYSKFQG